MGEYARSARGVVTSNGSMMQIPVPFEPQTVQIYNQTVYAATLSGRTGAVANAFWDFDMGQGSAITQLVGAATPYALIPSYLASGGISAYSAGISLQFGNPQQVQTSTQSGSSTAPTSFYVPAHGYQTGDVVIFEGLYASASTGMPQMCGMPFVVNRTDADNFTVPWNSSGSNYTDLTNSPTPVLGANVMQVLFPYLYAPGVSFISSIALGSTTTVTTTAPHNLVAGSEVAFRIPKVGASGCWGTVQLNALNDPRRPGSPIYGYVMAVNSPTSVTVKINSSNFTAFNPNVPVKSVVGMSFPQMIAVGDINSGGTNYSGGNLYPSPVVNGVQTINGPGISGAFVNNTSSGFIIGQSLSGTANDILYWYASLYDYSNS